MTDDHITTYTCKRFFVFTIIDSEASSVLLNANTLFRAREPISALDSRVAVLALIRVLFDAPVLIAAGEILFALVLELAHLSNALELPASGRVVAEEAVVTHVIEGRGARVAPLAFLRELCTPAYLLGAVEVLALVTAVDGVARRPNNSWYNCAHPVQELCCRACGALLADGPVRARLPVLCSAAFAHLFALVADEGEAVLGLAGGLASVPRGVVRLAGAGGRVTIKRFIEAPVGLVARVAGDEPATLPVSADGVCLAHSVVIAFIALLPALDGLA